MSDVTRILTAIEQGNEQATNELLPLVYQELRRLATQRLSQESSGQTLQATALVHEAYIRLIGDESQGWDNRGHFFKAAAEAMRRILVENARRKKRIKRGGGFQRVPLNESGVIASEEPLADDIVSLDIAMSKFAQKDELKAELVKLRFFGGLTIPQAAQALGISHATAERHWIYARCWLRAEIQRQRDTNGSS